MTSMTFNQPRNAGVLAMPLSVEGVDDNDPAGHVPRDLLINGTRIVIPYWIDPVPNDELWVVLRQNGVEHRLYTEFYPTPLTVPFLYFDLTAQHLATDGIAFLYYKIWKGSGGTDDPSPERQLTIDHTPLLTLEEPWFRHATLRGYLNNDTNPPLTSGATVVIPSFINIALPGDIAKVHWRGYSSLNGSGPEVPGTYGVWDKQLSAADIANGFDHVVPFLVHISPLFDYDSAVVVCQLFRGGWLIAESEKGLVKIDRVIPGESGPSGLNDGEIEMTALEQVTFKARPKAPRLGGDGAGVFAISISVDTIADDFIPKSQVDTGKIVIALARFTEEEELDDLDIYAAVEGQTLTQIDYKVLGPIADRTDPILLELDVSKFPELSQPADPTAYEVRVIVYKGGAGNDDPSNVVRIVRDDNPPFGVKYPSKRLNPPTPLPTFVNAPVDAQRLVNEAWMQLPANANLDFTLPVTYPLRRADDELEVHLVSGGVDIVAFKGTITGSFSVPNAELRKLPNGRVMIHYFWKDHVGNLSASSVPAALLTLGLALDPVLHKAPLVPVTDPNGTTTIYLDEFFANKVSSIVERAFIDNAEPGDEITLLVEDASDPTNFKQLGPQPLAAADLTFSLPYPAFFADLFGASTDAMEFKVWFELVRGAKLFPSPELFFWANLYAPGGLYPELPNPTNPAFVFPVVTGASNTPNDLLPGDRDKPGKFTVTLGITDPPITSAETAKCYINNKLVGEYSPFADATSFVVDIKTADITALPTPTVPAHWTRQRTGIDKNVISSNPETVQVKGKRIDLLQPTIRIRNPTLKDQMDCFAMNNATTAWVLAVGIPKDAVNLPPGKVITVHFAAYSDATYTTLIPGTPDSKPYTIQAVGTVDVATVASAANFKAAQPTLGSKAWAKVWYEADIGGTQTSIELQKPLDTITSSGEYCDRLVVPAT
ncbi:hypothetical protein [Pseudomonas sp. B21-048]|uniref:hypothetical protein n=1 Tax=Pseudomonas sp. B21-048 TaxID=2895490 RepID=UPI002160B533|nr:hypothetical protein [Pseudomonas sp. B21-048]UVL01216.1 hypothetical protein LOY56_13185 [Pseudomonas sp. B21-048]